MDIFNSKLTRLLTVVPLFIEVKLTCKLWYLENCPYLPLLFIIWSLLGNELRNA